MGGGGGLGPAVCSAGCWGPINLGGVSEKTGGDKCFYSERRNVLHGMIYGAQQTIKLIRLCVPRGGARLAAVAVRPRLAHS